jgi:hypothetical protein
MSRSMRRSPYKKMEWQSGQHNCRKPPTPQDDQPDHSLSVKSTQGFRVVRHGRLLSRIIRIERQVVTSPGRPSSRPWCTQDNGNDDHRADQRKNLARTRDSGIPKRDGIWDCAGPTLISNPIYSIMTKSKSSMNGAFSRRLTTASYISTATISTRTGIGYSLVRKLESNQRIAICESVSGVQTVTAAMKPSSTRVSGHTSLSIHR